MSFHDHFSGHADIYAAARPDYPQELFAFLASLVSNTDLAWDCAAGNGQAARGLMDYFDNVLMSDGSAEQILQGKDIGKGGNVNAAVMLAESLAIKSESVDIAVVAQALHWFNLNQFFKELDRVLRSGGVFAAWSYGLHAIDEECDAIVNALYEGIVGDYWPPERRLVEAGYKDIVFPFSMVEVPAFKLEKQWSIEQVLGYLNSWSAVQRYIAKNGTNPIAMIEPELKSAFGVSGTRTISWPLTLIVRVKD